jgi:hypothetical protein
MRLHASDALAGGGYCLHSPMADAEGILCSAYVSQIATVSAPQGLSLSSLQVEDSFAHLC